MTTANGDADVVMGEVRTALLQNSSAVSTAAVASLLAFTVGEQVRLSERPTAYAVSPTRLTGVDCDLPAMSRRGQRPTLTAVRGIGTVLSRGIITGGQVVQGSSYTRVRAARAKHRLPWSHYLARPGVVELLGQSKGLDVAAGHLRAKAEQPLLDLGAISDRTIAEVHSDEQIDHRAPFKSSRTRLRWVAAPGTTFAFTLTDRFDRTIALPATGVDPADVAHLCEDIALHDWLLTTLLSLIGRVPAGSAARRQVVERLGPAVDYLLHLWMPAARVNDELARFWQGVERRPGLSRQWQTNVDRVRDQLALAMIAELGHRP